MDDLISIGQFAVGTCLPLLFSALIPNGVMRWGACLFAILGIALLAGITMNSSAFSIGMSVGFMLASAKLLTGLRFIF